MGKIFVLMGKSACGKDTIFKMLIEEKGLALRQITLYTTRPMREEEENGREYFFVTEDSFEEFLAQGKVIEYRTYQTVHGPWTYFTALDGQIDLERRSYLLIATLEAYNSFVQYFGKDAVVPVLITLEDGERLQRALDRERRQDLPRYEEMCRRFLADSEDFCEENIARAGISESFENRELIECELKICEYIRKALSGKGSEKKEL
ncbi:MAG: guanylate kinase [Lachnospiraceae bacterium]|nr:guanylate kinase [Lachnospiraceae bacterium]